MFTISDTLLNASGKYALMAFFGVQVAINTPQATQTEAFLNIGVLLICAALALTVMIRYIGWNERKV